MTARFFAPLALWDARTKEPLRPVFGGDLVSSGWVRLLREIRTLRFDAK